MWASSNKSVTNYCIKSAEVYLFCAYYTFLYVPLLTTLTGTQKAASQEKDPLPSSFFHLSSSCLFYPLLKNVNGCFLLPPLLFFRGGRALSSIALVSHREGIPKVSVGPLICVLHCPNSLCLSFPRYLSPSIPSLSRPVLHNHLFYRFFSKAPEGFNYVHRQPL